MTRSQDKTIADMPRPTIADTLLNDAYTALGLLKANAATKYSAIPRIISHLAGVHAATPVNEGTTGTISERLCSLALEQLRSTHAGFSYRRFGKDWKWIGDILVSGDPYDLAVSVKSYKAKERLLASGTGSLLTPTIGWGLFDDVKEWSANRTASYLYRGFIAIYMPGATLAATGAPAKAITNINGKPLLRDLVSFPGDIASALVSARVDCRKI
ncbi:MAG: hypothetical protein AB1593_05690 [Pseudomonadota bacterium]